MSNQKVPQVANAAKRAGKFAFLALTLTGCIVIKVPHYASNDPYQPPAKTPIALKKGDVHKLRFECGAQATFHLQNTAPESFVVAYEGENMHDPGDKTSTALRLTWKGTGTDMDIPFNVGSQNTRKAMGNFTMAAPAGAHDFAVAMPNGPDCGSTKVTVSFK